jgi:hypothetical protein
MMDLSVLKKLTFQQRKPVLNTDKFVFLQLVTVLTIVVYVKMHHQGVTVFVIEEESVEIDVFQEEEFVETFPLAFLTDV